MKVIEINDDGYIWHVPLLEVAKNRATFYSDTPDFNFQDEVDYVMEDTFEGIDWFANNMDFSDLAHVSKLVKTPAPKEEPDLNADKQIVDIPDTQPQEEQ